MTHVLCSFDLSFCRVAYDGRRFTAHDAANSVCLRRGSLAMLAVRPRARDRALMDLILQRVMKYRRRGFAIITDGPWPAEADAYLPCPVPVAGTEEAAAVWAAGGGPAEPDALWRPPPGEADAPCAAGSVLLAAAEPVGSRGREQEGEGGSTASSTKSQRDRTLREAAGEAPTAPGDPAREGGASPRRPRSARRAPIIFPSLPPTWRAAPAVPGGGRDGGAAQAGAYCTQEGRDGQREGTSTGNSLVGTCGVQ
jgi:hypothetical protein